MAWIEISFDNFNNIYFTSLLKYIVWLMSLGSYHSPLLHDDSYSNLFVKLCCKNKLWKYEGPHNTLSQVYSRNFRPLFLHSFTQMKSSFSPLKILNRAKIEFWTLGQLKTKKIKINKNQIKKKLKGNIYPILSMKLWYQMIR